MSGTQSPPGAAGTTGSTTAGDPSLEDILASIRRILSEDETAPPAEASPAHKPDAEAGDSVLVLDPTMMVSEPTPVVEETPVAEPPTRTQHPVVPMVASVETGLVAPEAAAAAASSVGGLVRRLAAERYTQVHSGGPTIEDVVREEIRPLLKEWLDTHLPALVERLVRAEIERVVGRVVP